MKTEDILFLDCRQEKNKKIIQKVLRKIKAFEKYKDNVEDIPLEMLEKAVVKFTKIYKIEPQWISICFQASDTLGIYSVSVKTSDTNQWLGSVYAASIYELFAKLVIKMYSEIKQKGIEKRREK